MSSSHRYAHRVDGSRERLHHAVAKSVGRAQVGREAHHAHGPLELGVVEAALPVDDHDHPVRREALVGEERTHGGAGQAGTQVGQHDGRDPVEARGSVRGQLSSQSAGTYTGDSTITPAGPLMPTGPNASNDVTGCHGNEVLISLATGAFMAVHTE